MVPVAKLEIEVHGLSFGLKGGSQTATVRGMGKYAVAIALIIGLIAPQVAQADREGRGVASGYTPLAVAGAWIDSPKRGPRIEVRASPAANLTVQYEVRCYDYAADLNRSVKGHVQTDGRLSWRLGLPQAHPENCNVSVIAQYRAARRGRIAISIFD